MVSTLTLGASCVSSPSTPTPIMSSSASHDRSIDFDMPTKLCRWSIHIKELTYTRIPEPQVDAQDGFNIQEEDPSSWSQWPSEDLAARSFEQSMQESITQGAFTSKQLEDLPVSTEVIAQSLQKDPTLLQADAVKFAIIAGNVEILADLAGAGIDSDGIHQIYAFHLAAYYLDGGNQCCGVINELYYLLGTNYVFFHNVDDKGHTVRMLSWYPFSVRIQTSAPIMSVPASGQQIDIQEKKRTSAVDGMPTPRLFASSSVTATHAFLPSGNTHSATPLCRLSAIVRSQFSAPPRLPTLILGAGYSFDAVTNVDWNSSLGQPTRSLLWHSILRTEECPVRLCLER